MEGNIVVEKVKEKKGAYGFNARTDQYEDMLEAGVIDPTKVTRFALQNAASVASLLLTTRRNAWLLINRKRRVLAAECPVCLRAADIPAWACNRQPSRFQVESLADTVIPACDLA
jgi:hypothetical protein